MSNFSIPDIIKLGDISVPLAANYQYDGEVLGKRLATTSPLTIAIVTDALRWHYEGFPPTSLEDAVGSITITDVGNDGDKVEIFVNDVELGLISLGSYIKQPTDTDVSILAQNIFDALTNLYGYMTSLQDATITITVRPGLGASMNGNNRLQPALSFPTLSASAITAFSNTIVNNSSLSKFIRVSGALLYGAPDNITITAPTNFQVSSDNSTWGSSTTIPFTSDTLSNVQVYVMFSPTSVGNLSGNLSITGGGVTVPVLVPVSGTAIAAPSLTASALNTFPNIVPGSNSASQYFELEGLDLTGAPGVVSITAPSTSFQISTNNINWFSSVTIPYTTSSLPTTSIYVRFIPQSVGVKSGNISISGGSASTTVAVSGTGVVEFTFEAFQMTSIRFDNIKTTNGFTMLWNVNDLTTAETFASGQINGITHTYPSAYTGNVKLQVTNLADVENIYIAGGNLECPKPINNTTFTVRIQQSELIKLTGLKEFSCAESVRLFNVTTANLPSTLTKFAAYYSYMTGSVGSLPIGLTEFILTETNTISGTLSALYTRCPNLTFIRVNGTNTISGTIGSINANTISFTISGQNSISGNLSAMPSLPNLTFFALNGLNVVSGDLSDINGGDWSNIDWVEIGGGNSNPFQPVGFITGNVDEITFSPTMSGFAVRGGANDITGSVANLPKSLSFLFIDGISSLYPSSGNTLTGQLYDLPTDLTGLFAIFGNNTLEGSIDEFPATNAEQIVIGGDYHIVSGNIADLPAKIRFVQITGALHTVEQYAGSRAWGTDGVMNYVNITGASTPGIFTQSEVNQFIIDLDTNTTWSPSGSFPLYPLRVEYKGLTPNSSQAIAAKNSLIAKGVSVITIAP